MADQDPIDAAIEALLALGRAELEAQIFEASELTMRINTAGMTGVRIVQTLVDVPGAEDVDAQAAAVAQILANIVIAGAHCRACALERLGAIAAAASSITTAACRAKGLDDGLVIALEGAETGETKH